MPTIYASGDEPFGRNLPLSRTIRLGLREDGFRSPVIAAGGIQAFEFAEAALQRGDCEVVASARKSLADPDWFLKARLGRGDWVRRCPFTNYCESLEQQPRDVTYRLWGPLGRR
jgi:2,4-dienoyl-CoA reductase-like NADH-dependent reductase (Old Yellow Enzyme family)